jgi:hypothetical protein
MIDAVYKLYPQVVRTVGNVAYDFNGNEIAYDEDAVKSYADTYAYINKRIAEYPSIQEQLDMQYWDKVNNTNNWEQAIQSVKSKYPKP